MLSELLFPSSCIACGQSLQRTFLCARCHETLFEYVNIRCPICTKRLPDGIICDYCRTKLHFSRFISAIPYAHPIGQTAIHHLKYKNIKKLAAPLGAALAHAIHTTMPDYAAQKLVVMPIPLSDARKRWRGFNQSAFIARTVATLLNVELAEEKILQRTKNTKEQAKLKRDERLKNVRGVFAVKNQEKIKGRTILLIDDVATTCTTLTEAAIVLQQHGAKSVWAAVVAKE